MYLEKLHEYLISKESKQENDLYQDIKLVQKIRGEIPRSTVPLYSGNGQQTPTELLHFYGIRIEKPEWCTPGSYLNQLYNDC